MGILRQAQDEQKPIGDITLQSSCVYPESTATTATIADLDHDTEYKIRMRARYYTGEHKARPWGGPWASATITVAGEPEPPPTPEPAEEEPVQQPPREDPAPEDTTPAAGTIDTLAATDDDTGQLVLTWGSPAAPHAEPTDYHVNWAKSAEDYPADTAEAGNAHPTTTTHTLTGLEYDIQYNIRVRARYTDGENADSPWNGPWTETTAQVKLPLPAAPFIGAAAATPDGEVNLLWFNLDGDDSITGYQILRGPDADNLVVIEEDTGSSSTSYIDATAPAGETHTYGVRARNATGLSPLSDTVTVTVPAPEEEEELVTASHTSTDTTLVSNLGQTALSGNAIAGSFMSSHHETAMPFTTGTNTPGYHLSSMQLNLRKVFGSGILTPQVSIRGDNAGLPSDTVLSTLTTSTAITSVYQLITFTTPDEVTLQPNTTYWLHVNANIEGRLGVQQTASDNEDTESQAGWSIGDHRVGRIDGGAWTTDNKNLQMKILGHVILPTLVSNLRQTAVSGDAQAGFVSGNHHETAMPFTTGDNALGYHPTSIQLYLSRVSGPPLVKITIREDNAGLPGETTLARLNMSTAITAAADIPQLITFTTSGEVTLQPDTLYWLHVNASTTVAPAGVQQTASDDEDTESQAGWSIGDHRVSRIDGGAWTTPTSRNSLQMRILGHIILPTIVDLPADITTTARLAVNDSVTGQHEHGNDVDWFSFTAEADTNYQFTANQGQRHATLNVLRIFQDDGTELRNSLIAKKDDACHAVDRFNNIAFRTDTAGTYYVSIEGWNGGGSNVPYTLAMFDDDYSDDITTTGVVDVGESFQNYVMRTDANPESSRTDDVDWIRVALKADVTYEIVYDVACLHQGRIEGIYGPDGTLLPDTTLDWPRKTKGWCTDLTTEFTPSSDDDYYIAVSAQGSHFPRASVNSFEGVQGTLTITTN